MNIPIDVDAKLLIIPEKDVDEYDVMMLAEETCEMVRQLRIEAFIMHSFL
jgi:sodium/hydrogen exchanger 10/11